MSLRVLSPGLYSLLVDHGRRASRSLGVSVGGAADRAALALGNGLVGNAPDAVALEVCLAGPVLRAESDLACVVYGAPFELSSTRQYLRAGTTFTLRAGEELHVGGTAEGARAYLCVRGGFQTPRVLGSGSALEPLRAGDELTCLSGSIRARFIRPELAEDGEPDALRVVDGPQAGWFAADDFYPQEFVVTPASDRMGLRLRGAPLPGPGRELVSEPVCPGAVQVTRDGQCIVLGVDGQTIGGYPKVAQVISADLDRLGRLRPGERVRFARVSLDEAERLYRRRQRRLREWVTRLLA
jgi:antagonist of KipI